MFILLLLKTSFKESFAKFWKCGKPRDLSVSFLNVYNRHMQVKLNYLIIPYFVIVTDTFLDG